MLYITTNLIPCLCEFIIQCININVCKAVIQYNCSKLLTHISIIFCIYCIEIFDLENTDLFHATNDTDVMKSTCQIDFATVNNQPTLINQPMTSPINTATHNLSMNAIFTLTTESAIFTVTTDPAILNGTTESAIFNGTTESTPLAILVVSVTCSILGLCIIFTCIVGLIVIKKKRRNDTIRKGIFIGESLTSVLNRYIVYPLSICICFSMYALC